MHLQNAYSNRRSPVSHFLRPITCFLSCVFFLLSFTAPASAQAAFGIGGRMAMIRDDAHADTTSLRFLGGQMRLKLSKKTAVEVSLDRRREDTPDLTRRITDYPFQGTLLLYLARSTFSPYLLGGFGWYTHKVETLTGTSVFDTVSTHRTGYHAGFGAEIMAGRHFGMHGDYRYTFIHFGDSTPSVSAGPGAAAIGTSSLVGHLLPSYDGSMWTAGFTFYF